MRLASNRDCKITKEKTPGNMTEKYSIIGLDGWMDEFNYPVSSQNRSDMRATTTISDCCISYGRTLASPRGQRGPFAFGSILAGSLVRGYETFEMPLQKPVEPLRCWLLLAWPIYRRKT